MRPWAPPQDRERLVQMLKALGNPIRFAIVEYLRMHPGCITGELVDVLPIVQSTTSQHLKVLKAAGVIKGTLEGAATNYCLDEASLVWFKSQVRDIL